jgi:hypothetical protein
VDDAIRFPAPASVPKRNARDYTAQGLLHRRSELVPKVVVADIANTTVPRKPTSIRKKKVHGSDGRVRNIMLLDLNSATFGDDLTYAFEKNVAKARRENKKLFGSADGIARKK